MKRRLIAVIKGEKGQALPIVLVLMLLGGLLIAPSLSYASTSLNAGRIVEKKVNGLYAADAGVEYALWCLKNSIPPPEQLPEEEGVNQMAVEIEPPVNMETYTLYFGGLLKVTEQHYDSLAVYGEMGKWDPVREAYPYTITVTWQEEAVSQKVNLEEVGVRLPVGFVYKPDSAADPSFTDDNLSDTEPDDTPDGTGAHMLNWTFGSPRPYVTDPEHPLMVPLRTQMFYVTGDGALEGDYTWIKGAHGQSIGEVGEIIGTLYRITATASQDGEDTATVATVAADAIVYETGAETEICVILWQINPPEE